MKPKNTTANKILIGLALADALGVPAEFKSRGHLKDFPVTDMQEFGTHHQPAGTWSDDSSLAFCLADSLCEGYHLKDIAQKFILWRNGKLWTPHGLVFDIGIQTTKSIAVLEGICNSGSDGDLKLLRYEPDEYTNGNGSLMRILPLLGYVKGLSIAEQFEIIWDVSALTHGHIRSAIACLFYLKFAEFILKGMSLNDSYRSTQQVMTLFFESEQISEVEKKHFNQLLFHDISELSEDEIKSDGYVMHTLEASFWCLLNTKSYEEAVFKAINLGEDTDTTAAVVGGVAGLFYGLDEIPEHWIAALARLDDILVLGEAYQNKYTNLN